MSLIPHLEQGYGTFFPKGGIYQIADSLYRLAVDVGVTFHFETKVDEIVVTKKKATGIITKDNTIDADIIVSNMDIVPTYKKLLPNQKYPKRTLQQERSSSALIFYWGISKTFKKLDLHNIFFSENYQEEFETLFEKKSAYHDPTIYVNISAKNEPKDAPEGCENWFVMVNVSGNDGQDWDNIIATTRDAIIKKISKILAIDITCLLYTSPSPRDA